MEKTGEPQVRGGDQGTGQSEQLQLPCYSCTSCSNGWEMEEGAGIVLGREALLPQQSRLPDSRTLNIKNRQKTVPTVISQAPRICKFAKLLSF